MFKMNKGGVKAPKIGGSAKVHMAVGSGSRPNKSNIAIESSAPMNAHTLDSRATKGFLK